MDSILFVTDEEKLFCHRVPLIPLDSADNIHILDWEVPDSLLQKCLTPTLLYLALQQAAFVLDFISLRHMVPPFKGCRHSAKRETWFVAMIACSVSKCMAYLKADGLYHPKRPPNLFFVLQ
jgi:hypothetical protein